MKDYKPINNPTKPSFTFAEIYQKRVQRLRSLSKSSTNVIRQEEFSPGIFQQELYAFVKYLERDHRSAFDQIKVIIDKLPLRYEHAFNNWVDPRGMDVLQLSIVFNKPEIIRLILSDNSRLFPEDHVPSTNPYAHLAATLGFLECLEALLTNRPSFYFPATMPQHQINIHKDLPKRVRLNQKPEGGPSVNKHVQRLLSTVSQGAFEAEKGLNTKTDLYWNDSHIFDKEISSIKQTRSFDRRRMLARCSMPSIASLDSEIRTMPKNATQYPYKFGCGTSNLMKKREHVISVYIDLFKDEPRGVVNGAGPSVKIVQVPDLEKSWKPPIPSIDDVRILSENSRRAGSMPHNHANKSVDSVSKSSNAFKKSSHFRRGASKGNNKSNSAVTGRPSLANKPMARRISTKIDFGLRTIKKYKDFQLIPQDKAKKPKDKSQMNKTPLQIAAENGHIQCIKYLLKEVIQKNYPTVGSDDFLTLATKKKSPEAIAVLMSSKYSRDDLQSAILAALRDFHPACLTVLLNSDGKERGHLFGGESLFHIFYSQSLNSYHFRYEMMPEMTRTLILCHEEVNSRATGSTHPMYTLISCAFNIEAGRQCLFYLECLKILLIHKANPHYNEVKQGNQTNKSSLSIMRQPYQSALHCVFASAKKSTHFLAKPYWSKIITQKFIDCIVVHDKTSKRLQNDILFCYMEHICQLGPDRRILRSLFRYGADPDFKLEGKYAINKLFDEVVPFMTKFELKTPVDFWLDALMYISYLMKQECLHEAFRLFLDEHLLHTPLQALSLTRRFCYEVNDEIRTPRSLVRLAGQNVWMLVRRNASAAKRLPIAHKMLPLIVPN